MKLEMAILAGPEAKAFLVQLTKQIDRLEALVEAPVKKVGMDTPHVGVVQKADEEEMEEVEKEEIEEVEEETEEDDFAAKPSKAKKAKASSFDEEEIDDEPVRDDEDAEKEEPAPKKAKAKTLTIDDCNDAARALALNIGGKPGREKVYAIMKKHFQTDSVSELKPEDFAKFVDLMKKGMK